VTEPSADTNAKDLAARVTMGLTKIGQALKSQSWQDASPAGLSPTQAQILSILRTRDAEGMRLSSVAKELAVTPATASDAVTALVEKGLVEKKKAADDRRAIAITLTPSGRQQAEQVSGWSDFLKVAVDELSPEEQAIFLQGLIKIISKLQEQGQIPFARMCLTCQYFRPNMHGDSTKPHHCEFINAPLANQDLQVNCPDHLPQESA